MVRFFAAYMLASLLLPVGCSSPVASDLPSQPHVQVSPEFWQPVEGFEPTDDQRRAASIAHRHLMQRDGRDFGGFYKVQQHNGDYYVWINYAMTFEGKPIPSPFHATVIVSAEFMPVRVLSGA